METTIIKVRDQEIVLNVGANITVGVMRKIYPIIKAKSDNEIDMVIDIIKALSDTHEVEKLIDSLSMEEFQEVTEQVAKLIDATSQKKK